MRTPRSVRTPRSICHMLQHACKPYSMPPSRVLSPCPGHHTLAVQIRVSCPAVHSSLFTPPISDREAACLAAAHKVALLQPGDLFVFSGGNAHLALSVCCTHGCPRHWIYENGWAAARAHSIHQSAWPISPIPNHHHHRHQHHRRHPTPANLTSTPQPPSPSSVLRLPPPISHLPSPIPAPPPIV